MSEEADQLARIHAHARALWGAGNFDVVVTGQLATLHRDGVELWHVRCVPWRGTALDGLERTLRQRVADVS
jgi:hypothetical protein